MNFCVNLACSASAYMLCSLLHSFKCLIRYILFKIVGMNMLPYSLFSRGRSTDEKTPKAVLLHTKGNTDTKGRGQYICKALSNKYLSSSGVYNESYNLPLENNYPALRL